MIGNASVKIYTQNKLIGLHNPLTNMSQPRMWVTAYCSISNCRQLCLSLIVMLVYLDGLYTVNSQDGP